MTTGKNPPSRKAPVKVRSKDKKVTIRTARKIAKYALEKKAGDVQLLDVRKITSVTDFFIICSGDSSVQVKAIAENVRDKCREDGIGIYNVEGMDAQRWVLIDMVEVVVHVFLPDVRAYYQLERLWGDAPTEYFDDETGEATA